MRSSSSSPARPAPPSGLEMALAAAVTGLAVFVLARPKPGSWGGEVVGPGKARSRIAGPGGGAGKPSEIPVRGWGEILKRTWREMTEDHITIIAGGITYSVLLAIFPALGAFVAIYGLVADVNDIPRQMQTLSAVLPSAAVGFIGQQMTRLARANHGGLSLAAALGLLIAFWSANGATKAFFVGLNVAYEVEEKRSFVHLTMSTMAFTLGLVLFVVVVSVAVAVGVAVPFLGPAIGAVAKFARWPLLLAAFAGGLAMLYQYAPCRLHERWRWVTPGSLAATLLWLGASLLYSVYTANFSHFDKTYGSLGAVIGLMVWIWISVVIVLFGAELNSEIEHQAALGKKTHRP